MHHFPLPNEITTFTIGGFKYRPTIILFQLEAKLVPKDCSSEWGFLKPYHPITHACMLDGVGHGCWIVVASLQSNHNRNGSPSIQTQHLELQLICCNSLLFC